jgi:uncharacterized membrane protein YeiH
MTNSHDDKYITFRRDELMAATASVSGGDWSDIEVRDAVVIRRQDLFATAALAGYAASIAIAARLTDDPKRKLELIDVADYFQRQSELAAEEGWKTPDV